MQTTIKINGEDRNIADFKAFKALEMVRLVADVEHAYREVLKASSTFNEEYLADNMMAFDRVEARRQFGPRPLVRTVETARTEPDEDGIAQKVLDADGDELVDREYVPMLDSEEHPIMGADPLGHLTEDDWAASDHKLRVPDPVAERQSGNLSMAAMIPPAFKLGRVQVLRLLALAVTTNSDLEKWDDEGLSIDGELDKVARELLHAISIPELIRLAVAVAKHVREEVGDPLDEAKAEWKAATAPVEIEKVTETPQVAAVFETAPASEPTSSTSAPESSDGLSEPSSTTLAGQPS